MEHRHIQPGDVLSTAAIDDIIDRGGRADWAFLRYRSRVEAFREVDLMQFKQLTIQYSFHTPMAISALKFVGVDDVY